MGEYQYRFFDRNYWTHRETRLLPSHLKMFFPYFFSNSHDHVSGLYLLPFPVVSFETGLDIRKVASWINQLIQHRKIVYDFDHDVVWVINMLKRQGFNFIANKSLMKATESQIRTHRNSGLITNLIQHYKLESIIAVPDPLPEPIHPHPHPHRQGVGQGAIYSVNNINPNRVSSSSSLVLSSSSSLKTGEIPFSEIISDLNTTCKTSFRPTSTGTQNLIRARWNEGFRFADFHKVHERQSKQWMGTDMQKYLRPETLYSPKHFESYLNGSDKKTSTRVSDFSKGF